MNTIENIYRNYELAAKKQKRRDYLGASVLGKKCRRELWYGFRWAVSEEFPGRILRLFDTGHREEERIIADLRGVGVDVLHAAADEQYEVKAVDGNVRGHLDGVLVDLPEAGEKYCLGEMKTFNDRGFKELVKKGVAEAKPVHYSQMQLYMHLGKLGVGAHIAQNKNTDELRIEIVPYDGGAHAEQLLTAAEEIVYSHHAPERISNDEKSFFCRFCACARLCHGGDRPPRNCRTCAHGSAAHNGLWNCERDGEKSIIRQCDQEALCYEHVYLPDMLGLTPVGYGDGYIEYEDFVDCGALSFPLSEKKTLER